MEVISVPSGAAVGACSGALTRGFQSQGLPRNLQAVRWVPPPPGWVKINTDGAFRGRTSGASSYGVVFWDFRGIIIAAFSTFLGYDKSALEAEMCGIIFAIDMAHLLRIRNVWIESDSLQAVFLLRYMVHDDTVPEKLRQEWGTAIGKARCMEVWVSHIFREGNLVADKLADYAIKNKGVWNWNNTPLFVLQEAMLDATGQTYLRVK